MSATTKISTPRNVLSGTVNGSTGAVTASTRFSSLANAISLPINTCGNRFGSIIMTGSGATNGSMFLEATNDFQPGVMSKAGMVNQVNWLEVPGSRANLSGTVSSNYSASFTTDFAALRVHYTAVIPGAGSFGGFFLLK